MNWPETLPQALAMLNATLNGTSGVLMTLGVVAAKQHKVARHKRLMLAAVVTSALFLVSYLTRIAIAGDTKFLGVGAIRPVYFAILISHVILAVGVLPLILRSVYLGLTTQIDKHRRIVKFTFPVWLYVSITGVVVYAMLYQMSW